MEADGVKFVSSKIQTITCSSNSESELYDEPFVTYRQETVKDLPSNVAVPSGILVIDLFVRKKPPEWGQHGARSIFTSQHRARNTIATH